MDQISDPIAAIVRAEVAPLIANLHMFIDRRIAELSMEIHATVQLVDYSESNLSGQLGRMQEQIADLISMPNAATRNSGVALEAVVQATESAANRILEAAEAIGDWLRSGVRDSDSLEAVAEQVNAIFEACSFQDITSQRIRRAIVHLQQVETMLTELAPGSGPGRTAVENPDLAQDDVDTMFG